MNVIICVDDKNGMLFNKRRQSKDSVLREKMLELCSEKRLCMNSYSAKQFGEDFLSRITVDEDFISNAKSEDYCFIENVPLPDSSVTDDIILFKWNRVYPSDTFFNAELLNGRTLSATEEFEGSSHEKITMEVYKK